MRLPTLIIIICSFILLISIFMWKINKLQNENWFLKHDALQKDFEMWKCHYYSGMLSQDETQICWRCKY